MGYACEFCGKFSPEKPEACSFCGHRVFREEDLGSLEDYTPEHTCPVCGRYSCGFFGTYRCPEESYGGEE